jgi:hypothetical protein
MSANQTFKWTRMVRKNWLAFLSAILLILSAYFVVKVEERGRFAPPNTDTNQSMP